MYRDIGKQIEQGSLLVTDGFMGFTTLSKELDCKLESIKSELHTNLNGYSLSSINQIYSELELYLQKYHGISTRRLQGYLNMFVLKKKLNYTSEYQFHVRDAWVYGVPRKTRITHRNESSIPYPFDVSKAFSNIQEHQYIGVA